MRDSIKFLWLEFFEQSILLLIAHTSPPESLRPRQCHCCTHRPKRWRKSWARGQGWEEIRQSQIHTNKGKIRVKFGQNSLRLGLKTDFDSKQSDSIHEYFTSSHIFDNREAAYSVPRQQTHPHPRRQSGRQLQDYHDGHVLPCTRVIQRVAVNTQVCQQSQKH